MTSSPGIIRVPIEHYMKEGRKQNKMSASNTAFPVVGIGASAGGLDALKEFLLALPPNPGMAFVFLQHLSPTHVSILPEILERFSPFPVKQIKDQIHIEPDTLYIVPENKSVTATDGVLQLSNRPEPYKKNDTIDVFFSSLGAVHQSYAIGIVLSGALSDGTIGLQVIKAYGGLTFAQDGGSATFKSMPNSAIKAGVIDFILSPARIAQRLIEINRPFQAGNIPAEDNEDGIFKQILTLLRARKGVDFQYYKANTLKRRIIRRMALGKTEKPADYLDWLRENKTEQDALYNDMLISVTSFFRDQSVFNILRNEVIPNLVKSKIKSGETLRIWIAGCATGEEAYSMAICLQESLGEHTGHIKVQIFATDISEPAIAKARSGIYRLSEMEGLSQGLIQQFFTKIDGTYQVNKTIRDMCVFAHHNLLKDPPFSKLDFLSCRNLMIYLEPVLQTKALTIFHYALNKDGLLLLGRSETIGRQTDLFSAKHTTEKLYSRKGPAGRYMNVASYARELSFKEINNDLRKDEPEKDIFKIAEETMVEHLIPPCVLINDKFDIIQFKGLTDPFLSFPKGKPSFNILKIAKDELAFELRRLLLQAKSSGEISHKYGVSYKSNELQHFVNLLVYPLTSTPEIFFLVAFQASSSTGIQPNMFELPGAKGDVAYDEAALHIEHLERELIQARAEMRVVSEEQESANEKLQSYNEELLSAGEEQQSVNEELETSKEELQSINEEIIIVNKELVDRNEQLNNARLYTEAIVNAIRDPLLILDAELRIKRASRSFYKLFKLTEDFVEGQYLYDIGQQDWDIPQLRELLERVLPDQKEVDDFKVLHEFKLVGELLLYLNARHIKITDGEDLILLAMEDATGKPDR